MPQAVIKKCTCKHDFQDKQYGKQFRVHTTLRDEGKGGVKYRCTVCGIEKG